MLQHFKIYALRTLLWLFEGTTCLLCIYLWFYACTWSLVVFMEPDIKTATGALLDQAQIGWHPHWAWSIGLPLLATAQMLVCMFLHDWSLVRLVLSIVTATGVLYTVLIPIFNTYLLYGFFPIASVGSFLVAIIAVLIVARNMREVADARR